MDTEAAGPGWVCGRGPADRWGLGGGPAGRARFLAMPVVSGRQAHVGVGCGARRSVGHARAWHGNAATVRGSHVSRLGQLWSRLDGWGWPWGASHRMKAAASSWGTSAARPPVVPCA